jgi:hypothetical protein
MRLSFILPFFTQIEQAIQGLTENLLLFNSDETEVVLVMDDNGYESILVGLIKDFKSAYPKLKFKVLINDANHEWRPPCKAINVGLRNATGDNVIVASPETMIRVPYNSYLEEMPKLSKIFIGGLLTHVESPAKQKITFGNIATVGYGFLMCAREDMESLNGFDESRTRYGGDDNDIRERLSMIAEPRIDFNIHLFHIRHENVPRMSCGYEAYGVEKVMPENYGKDFNRVAYDWRL